MDKISQKQSKIKEQNEIKIIQNILPVEDSESEVSVSFSDSSNLLKIAIIFRKQ